MMEELEVDKVIECWPTADQAAVARLEEFLEGETRVQIMAPMWTILPIEEWPEEVPKSYVWATDKVSEELVAEGYKQYIYIYIYNIYIYRE